MKNLIKVCLVLAIMFGASLVGINTANIDTQQNIECNMPTINIQLETPIVATESMPTSYDLRDYIYIDVENQYELGICYTFASLSSVETYIALNYNEYYDFSELHLATSIYMKDAERNSISEVPNSGGSFTNFFTYIQKDKYLALEEEMPLSDYPKAPNLFNSTYYTKLQQQFNTINSNFYPIVKVNDIEAFEGVYGNKSQYSASELTELRNGIKSHIMQNGSLTAGIHWSSSYLKNNKNYRVTNNALVTNSKTATSNVNHMISIIGWDDSYNAGGTWSNPGAYICLNSWGEEWGDNGYFYVSYEDYFIEFSVQGVTSATLATSHNIINTYSNHQQGTFSTVHSIEVSSPLYFAHVIDVSDYLNQNISYIDISIKGSASAFYIKFFDSKTSALNNIANLSSINNKIAVSLVSENYYYNKYMLNSPLKISNNYILIASYVKDIYRSTSIATVNNASTLEPTYYSPDLQFDVDYTWNYFLHTADPSETLNFTLPIRIHTNASFYKVNAFSNSIFTIDGSHTMNNAIARNQTLTFTINNASVNVSNIKIYSISDKDNNLIQNFSLSIPTSSPATINITLNKNSSLSEGNYFVSIPIEDATIYRVIKILDRVVYSIDYVLNGGTLLNKPNVYVDSTATLTIDNPTRAGYTFKGWYLNEELTQSFNKNNLPYTNITLYAKWDFAAPSITNKSNNVNITYYQGLEITIRTHVTHYFVSELNTLSYQWYKRNADQTGYTKIDGANSNSLTLYNAADSGYYVCEATININDTSLTDTPCSKSTSLSSENEIYVSIKKFEYDMSNVKWNYTASLYYNSQPQKVEVTGLPNGVSVNYTNNEFTNIGNYTAHAELVFDNMNGNASAEAIEDLNWSIRKAKITITINDITSKNDTSIEEIAKLYSCEMVGEYFPTNIVTHEDKLEYLNLQYTLTDTEQQYIKTISATTNSFDIHDIEIINGVYKQIINELTSNNITTTNENGFVYDCEFSAESVDVGEDIKALINKQHLRLICSYNLNYSYLDEEDTYSVFVPIEKELLYKGVEIYIVKDGKLQKTNISYSTNGVTGIKFNNNMQNATILIVETDKSHTSNIDLIVCISIIVIFLAWGIAIIVNYIKHKNEFII